MLYAIIARDREDSLADRQQARPDHLERLRALQTDGRLVLAGPHPAIDSEDPGSAGFTGSLIIALLTDLARQQGTTLLLVTHSMQVAQAADRVLRLSHGRVEAVTVP